MDPLNTLKKIRKIIRNTADRELVRLILDLQKEIFAVESHNLELASELASLKQQLDLPARMHTRPPSNCYFMDGDDVPFCPKCWEKLRQRDSFVGACIGGRSSPPGMSGL
jgi:hypothetical protein